MLFSLLLPPAPPPYHLQLTAGGSVNICELSSHQDNHLLNLDNEESIVSLLYSLQ